MLDSLEQDFAQIPEHPEWCFRDAADFVAGMDIIHSHMDPTPRLVSFAIESSLKHWNLIRDGDHQTAVDRIRSDLMQGSSYVISKSMFMLRRHPRQEAFIGSDVRFNICPAGRRSGKTEAVKRRGIRKAMRVKAPNGRVVFGGPTYSQARRIFWLDLKQMVPSRLIVPNTIRESEMSMRLKHNGCLLQVMGLDVPARIEGTPLDHLAVDEFPQIKSNAWGENFRPALSDPTREPGTADLTGVPEGRDHYYEMYHNALDDDSGEWCAHHWTSSEILPPKEVEAARRELDPRTFDQEYNASFVSFSGRAYYNFEDDNIVKGLRDKYDPNADLYILHDFNVDPGVAAIAQEFEGLGTCILGEVWIRDSNSELIGKRILQDWGNHKGRIYLYGDATGGARGTAAVKGSDWDILYKQLYKAHWGDRVRKRVPASNPSVRSRLNSMRCRIRTVDGVRHLHVDKSCRHTIRDFEGSVLDDHGDVAKTGDKNKFVTHLTDGIGYFVVKKYPVQGGRVLKTESYV